MFIVEVIPLTRGSFSAGLTYYSATPYDIGTIISIPIRNQAVRGLVTRAEPVSKAKTAVRRATFSLRKLPDQTAPEPLSPILLKTAESITKRNPATLGAILYALLPEEIRNGSQVLPTYQPTKLEERNPKVSVFQANKEERFNLYRGKIREAFAHRGSVLLVVPTTAHANEASEKLSSGIKERLVVFSGNLTAKKVARAYEGLSDQTLAKLIITTPAYATLDRHDITHIIIEESRSPYYKSKTRPYLDTRETLLTIAKQTGREVILGDILPRSEDEFWRREDFYQTEGEHPKRMVFNGNVKIIKPKEKDGVTEPFQLLSKELRKEIEKTLSNKERVFLYGARRGLAPIVFCLDCNYIFRCPDSGLPYSLFRTHKDGEEKRWFLSGTSGRRIKAADSCPECSSWRLRERGIGIQQIYDELCEHFPKDKVILFDHTTATTPRKIGQLMGNFYDNKGTILLGTAMALPYLEEPVALSAIVSLDATRSVPTWKADEELFSLLLNLRDTTTETLVIQTRTEPDELLEYVKTGQVDKFYDDELELRQALNYPPFAVLVHLTISGSASSLLPLETEITELLKKFEPRFYSAPNSTSEKTTRYCLIRIKKENWPDQDLIGLLRTLPPNVRIEINPDKII